MNDDKKEAGDSLGDRMKGYENANRNYLIRRTPAILRVDGRAFHTYIKGTKTPFDHNLMAVMDDVAMHLCENISTAVMAYVQSDEISVLLNDYKGEGTQQWFGGNVQKMTSISASLASVKMTVESPRIFGVSDEVMYSSDPMDIYRVLRPASFDSRVFALPKDEVCNYFIWRQQDWARNSLQMLARTLYSHQQLMNMGHKELHEMCFQKGKNWADLTDEERRGRVVIRRPVPFTVPAGPQQGEVIVRQTWVVDHAPPVFTADRQYVEALV